MRNQIWIRCRPHPIIVFGVSPHLFQRATPFFVVTKEFLKTRKSFPSHSLFLHKPGILWRIEMKIRDRRNIQTLMETGIFFKNGNLDELDVGVTLSECSNAGHDGPTSLAPRRIPQHSHHFLFVTCLVQCLLVSLKIADIWN